MAWLLVILFYVNGEPVIQDGWYPLPFRTETGCEIAAGKTRRNMVDAGVNVPYAVFCTEYPIK